MQVCLLRVRAVFLHDLGSTFVVDIYNKTFVKQKKKCVVNFLSLAWLAMHKNTQNKPNKFIKEHIIQTTHI